MKDLFRRKSILKIQNDVAKEQELLNSNAQLQRVLGVKDLTLLGLAAIIGAGVFSTVGSACYDGGPAVIWLFLGITIVCGFSALCYAEMASRIPVSGSAYTYTYTTFGELIAWIIGWDLIMEYAVGNVTVAISWSGNFVAFLNQLGIHPPLFLCKSYMEVKNAHLLYLDQISGIKDITAQLPETYLWEMNQIWESAPKLFGHPIILNIPAFMITFLITALVYVGIKESRKVSNSMVVFKVIVVLLIVVVGAFYVNPENWTPFAPNGFSGVIKGTSAVFFAYIGFDALATTAEECKNPQRDLPKGMLYSLIIATLLYIAVALVLTGLVPYTSLNNEAFLANAFIQRGIHWVGGVIAFSAIIATASVLLVFQMGQPRIWMSMSRDGLLPKQFSKIHSKFKTPSFSTIITGILVGVPSLFMDADFVTDMCSIGTLFAFFIVCFGVMVLEKRKDLPQPKFKVPYVNSRYFIPIIIIGGLIYLFKTDQATDENLFNTIFSLDGGFEVWSHQIPNGLFLISSLIILTISWKKQYSLIPLLGVISCLYLLSTLGIVNWFRFGVWLIIGILIYLFYGKKHSKLA
jgi:APA family basic amino acid/polyamine antiporter